jgi:hypothetical protein
MIPRKIVICFFLLSAVLLGLTLKWLPGNFLTPQEISQSRSSWTSFQAMGGPFENSRIRTVYVQMLSVIIDGDLLLSEESAKTASPDVGYLNGIFYSWAPPGLAIVAAFLYALGVHIGFGQMASYATITIVTLLCQLLLFRIARTRFNMPLWAATLVPALFVFATPAWVYSTTLLQHQFLTLFMLYIFYLIGKYVAASTSSEKAFYSCLIWALFGLSVFFDYPNIIILSPLMAYFLYNAHKNRAKKIFLYGSCIIVIIFGVQAMSNNLLYERWSQMGNTLAGYSQYSKGFLKYNSVQIAGKKNSLSQIFKMENFPGGIYTLTFKPNKGVFMFAPFLLFFIAGIATMRKRYPAETLAFSATIMFNFLLYAVFGDPGGGWTFGTRYLVPSMALMSIFAVSYIATTSRRKKIGVFLLILYSLLNSIAGVLTLTTINPEHQTLLYGIQNFQHILNGTSGNYLYNTFLSPIMPLLCLYIALFAGLGIGLYYLLFKAQDKEENYAQS